MAVQHLDRRERRVCSSLPERIGLKGKQTEARGMQILMTGEDCQGVLMV